MSRFPRYRRLIQLYPKSYRDRFADPMLQTLADMLDNEVSGARRAAIWIRTSAELPVGLIRQNAINLGIATMDQMPRYIKQNGLIAGLLLLPFVLALIANWLDKLIYNHTLYNSWLWSYPLLLTWVLILPALALVIALSSYAVYLRQSNGTSFFRTILDIRRNWPVTTVGVMATGIILMVFFHDSIHCLIHNPGYLAGHWGQTVSCIRQR